MTLATSDGIVSPGFHPLVGMVKVLLDVNFKELLTDFSKLENRDISDDRTGLLIRGVSLFEEVPNRSQLT